MEMIMLQDTDLKVSALGMGGSHLGSVTGHDTSLALLDHWRDRGLNLVDTAHIYGAKKPEDTGRSEEVIGEWIATRHARHELVLCTKGAHPELFEDGTSGPSRVRPDCVTADLEKSLITLKTDYIDLYFLHRDDMLVPVADILEHMEKLAASGKIRYYGCSNWTTPRIREAWDYAREHGLKGFVCNQLPASLAAFHSQYLQWIGMTCLDQEAEEFHSRTGMNVMTAMSLANGYFHKRMAGKDISVWPGTVYTCPENDAVFSRLAELREAGYPVTAVMYHFLRNFRFNTVPLMGFSNVKQLDDVLEQIEIQVPEGILNELKELRGPGVSRAMLVG